MTLGAFSKRMRRIAANVEVNSDRLVQKVAVSAMVNVILATPVDTGRARANWFLSNGTPILQPNENLFDKNGQTTIRKNSAVAATQNRGESIFITNNISYIGKLNEGSSKQAPANFAQISAAIAIRNIKGARIVK